MALVESLEVLCAIGWPDPDEDQGMRAILETDVVVVVLTTVVFAVADPGPLDTLNQRWNENHGKSFSDLTGIHLG